MRFCASKVIAESRSSKYIADYDDLLAFAEEYLDGDGIQFLRNTMTENGNFSDVSELRKVARVLEQGKEKASRGLTKEEIQAGMDALVMIARKALGSKENFHLEELQKKR